MASRSVHSRRIVSYYYDENVGNFYYGQGHPMKPQRIRMTHHLLLNYGVFYKMHVYRPRKATAEEMTNFHSVDYVRFLQNVRPDNLKDFKLQGQKYNVETECPVFDGMFEFSQISAGGSIAGAVKLNRKDSDLVINWAGGLHHAKKAEASGFCYVNDIVLAILELLKHHARVLYIDIDIHHGDGVEDAFYNTDRVMTVSFHKFGNFFPGTGELKDVGEGVGKYYSVNVPLDSGIDDDSYESIFNPIISKVMEFYRPNAIVMQCGADCLVEDRLGCFNLTLEGHAQCVRFVESFKVPLMLLGGGGYTVRNVARCWANDDTAVAIGVELPDEIPNNDFFKYYGPQYQLPIWPSWMANANSAEYLHRIEVSVLENLRMLPCAPGVEMQDIPEDGVNLSDEEDEDLGVQDLRISIPAADKRIVPENELSDSEDEGEDREDQRVYKILEKSTLLWLDLTSGLHANVHLFAGDEADSKSCESLSSVSIYEETSSTEGDGSTPIPYKHFENDKELKQNTGSSL